MQENKMYERMCSKMFGSDFIFVFNFEFAKILASCNEPGQWQ